MLFSVTSADSNEFSIGSPSFPGGSDGKESAGNTGDLGLTPGLGRSPGEGIGYPLQYSWASLGGSDGKESTHNMGDLDLIPGLGRFLGGRHGNPLLYSCLENPMDRGGQQATVHAVTKSWT